MSTNLHTVDWTKLEIVLYTLWLNCTALFRPLCHVPLNLPVLAKSKWREQSQSGPHGFEVKLKLYRTRYVYCAYLVYRTDSSIELGYACTVPGLDLPYSLSGHLVNFTVDCLVQLKVRTVKQSFCTGPPMLAGSVNEIST